MSFSDFYLVLVIINIALLSFAMYFTFSRLSARGAKPLFLFLFCMLAFTALFFCSLIVRTPEAKQAMIVAAYAALLVLPIFWTQLVYEISNRNTEDWWHFGLPFAVINLGFFLLFFIDLSNLGPMAEYYDCALSGGLYTCRVNNSMLYYVMVGFLLFEFLGGIGWLLYSFFAEQHNEERIRYLGLVVAVGFGTIGMGTTGTVFNDVVGIYDPLPFVLSAWTVLMLFAVFSKRLLAIQFRGQNVSRIEDLMLVVDSDHYIQDVTMTTLQIFGMEVQEVISSQLENSFQQHPSILQLFNEARMTVEPIEIQIEGETHTFEPKLTMVLDPETNLPIGQQLVLQDVTGNMAGGDNPTAVPLIRDPLTNQYNRESFYQFGAKLINNTRLRQQPSAIIVIDIDDFGSVNQRYSHLVGDQGLIQLVSIVNEIIRSSDLLARFQQDELVLLLPNADEYSAYQICSRIMKTVADHRFTFQEQDFQLTVSIGFTVTECNDDDTLEEIVATAYQALDQSHMLGRNRLTFLPMDVKVDEEF